MFLFFIGGLLLGGFLGFLALLVFASGLLALLTVVLVALVVPIGMVASINRRKWQGERHSVFNGGALGLGAAVMMSLTSLYYRSRLVQDVGTATYAPAYVNNTSLALTPEQQGLIDQYVKDHTFTLPDIAQALLLAAGLAALLFALGLFAGDAVRRRKQFGGALLATAIFLAPAVFLEELIHDWRTNEGGTWLWIVLLLAYGGIVAFFAERRLMPEGLTDEGKRQRRRARRKQMG